MKKKTPVTIKELDVQPISDEELKALEVTGAAAESEWIIIWCDCNSDVETWECWGNQNA